MSINQLNPYLSFNGNAEKVIKFYESALGAKTENLMRWSELPGENLRPEHKNKVLHSMLTIGDGILMIADSPPATHVAQGTNVHVCMSFDDEQEMAKRFNALALDGRVTLPIQETFWGAKFGMLIDPFGVQWMFNCPKKR